MRIVNPGPRARWIVVAAIAAGLCSTPAARSGEFGLVLTPPAAKPSAETSAKRPAAAPAAKRAVARHRAHVVHAAPVAAAVAPAAAPAAPPPPLDSAPPRPDASSPLAAVAAVPAPDPGSAAAPAAEIRPTRAIVSEPAPAAPAPVTPAASIANASLGTVPPPAPPPAPAPAVARAEPVLAALVPPAAPVAAAAPAAAPITLPIGGTKPGAAAPDASITWEGQLRFRYEARSVLDYRMPGTFKRAGSQRLDENGDQSTMRSRVGAALRLGSGVRGYLNLQDARVMGAEGSPGGAIDNVDLYLAYVDLDSLTRHPLSLRLGRQVFQYGDARIVSGSDWSNAGRGWDGARMRWAPRRWQVDGLVSWVTEGRLTGADRVFSGLDALWKPRATFELEGYTFSRSFGDTGFVSEKGRKGGLYDATSGLRARVARKAIEFKAEGAVQRGRRAGESVTAWFGASRATLDLPGAWKPRAGVEWIAASGDRNPTDGASQRFDPVYWGGHPYMGTLDVVGCANVTDWNGTLVLQPRKAWGVTAELHRFRLREAKDAWADDAGTTLRRSTGGAAGLDLGRELDLACKWEPRGRVTVLAGWSHLWAGDYVRRTGGGNDLDWGFTQLAVGF